jgi:hypothetical protein
MVYQQVEAPAMFACCTKRAPLALLRLVQEVEERDALVQLINSQAKELETLKTQVLTLKRKDTSVYA